MSQTIQLRRDTAANWASSDPVLNQGEVGIETDTGKGKLGDGSTAWTSLAYWNPDASTADVASVFGRTGAVTAQSGDYTAAQVGAVPWSDLTLVPAASSLIGGTALVNGTPVILSWTAPDDGLLHWAFVAAYLHASSDMTGGELGNGFTDPQGNAVEDNVFVPGSQPSGYSQWQTNLVPVQAGTAVTVYQATALTGGAAQAWAGIWGS